MSDLHDSNWKYVNVLLVYGVGILNTNSLGFRDTHNNKNIYMAIANGNVNCSLIQGFIRYVSLTTTWKF